MSVVLILYVRCSECTVLISIKLVTVIATVMLNGAPIN